MSDITSFFRNNTYYYNKEQWVSASGSSGCSSTSEICTSSCSSGASAASNSSASANVSSASGYYQYVCVGTVGNLNINEIVNLFKKGNLTKGEMENWLKAHNKYVTELSFTEKDGIITYKFMYKNNEYTVGCSAKAASSQLDNDVISSFYSYNTLSQTHKFTDEQINEYFAVVYSYGNTKQYILKPNNNFKTISALKTYIENNQYKDAKNKSLTTGGITSYQKNGVYHYGQQQWVSDVSGNVSSSGSMYASGALAASNSSASANASTASAVSNSSASAYASSASGPSGHYEYVDIGTVKNLSISEIVNLFKKGNLTKSEMDSWLKAQSKYITELSFTEKDGMITYKFVYNNKEYTVGCTSEAAASQIDNNVVTSFYSYNTLSKTHKFTDEQINEYFAGVYLYGSTKQYILKPNDNFKTIAELKTYINKLETEKDEECRRASWGQFASDEDFAELENIEKQFTTNQITADEAINRLKNINAINVTKSETDTTVTIKYTLYPQEYTISAPIIKNDIENLDDELYKTIISNANLFVALNCNKTNVDTDTLFNNCITAQIRLSIIAHKLDLDMESFINNNLAGYVEELCKYNQTMQNGSASSAEGTRRARAKDNDSSSKISIPDSIKNILHTKYGSDIVIKHDSLHSSDDFQIFDVTSRNGDHICLITLEDNNKYCWRSSSSGIGSVTNYDLSGNLINEQKSITNGSEFISSIENGQINVEEFFNSCDEKSLLNVLGNLTTVQDHIKFGATSFYDLSRALKNKADFIKGIVCSTLNSLHYDDLKSLLDNGDSSIENVLSIMQFAEARNCRSNPESFCWNANGILYDVATEQGFVGNCWFLSGGITSSAHQEFLNILSSSVLSFNAEDQTYTVKIQGKEYTYTFEQLKGATELSNGDLDVRALEMCAREYFNSLGGNNPIQNGGWLENFTEFLTGKNLTTKYRVDSTNADNIFKNIASGEYLGTLSTMTKGLNAIDASTGELMNIETQHAYAVVGCSEEYIYIKNPWDSSKILKLDKKTFKSNGFSYCEAKVSDLVDGIEIANYDPIHTNDIDYKPDKLIDKIEGNTIKYKDGSYDVISSTNNKTTITRYDANKNFIGKIEAYTDKDGNKITNTYDNKNRIKKSFIQYPDGSSKLSEYYYNDNYSNIVITYKDKFNKLQKEESYINNEIVYRAIYNPDKTKTMTNYNTDHSYSIIYYDANGNEIKQEFYDSSDNLLGTGYPPEKKSQQPELPVQQENPQKTNEPAQPNYPNTPNSSDTPATQHTPEIPESQSPENTDGNQNGDGNPNTQGQQGADSNQNGDSTPNTQGQQGADGNQNGDGIPNTQGQQGADGNQNGDGNPNTQGPQDTDGTQKDNAEENNETQGTGSEFEYEGTTTIPWGDTYYGEDYSSTEPTEADIQDYARKCRQDLLNALKAKYPGSTADVNVNAYYDSVTNSIVVNYSVSITGSGQSSQNGGATQDLAQSYEELERWFAVMDWSIGGLLASLDGGGGTQGFGVDNFNSNEFRVGDDVIQVDGYSLELYELAVALCKNGQCQSLEDACAQIAQLLKLSSDKNGYPKDIMLSVIACLKDIIENNENFELNINLMENFDGTNDIEFIITKKDLSESLIYGTYNIESGCMIIQDRIETEAPTLEQLQLEFIEGIHVIENIPDEQLAWEKSVFDIMNKRLQQICNIISDELSKKYREEFIDTNLKGYTSSNYLLNMLSEYGYAGDSSTVGYMGDIHTDVNISNSAMYGYAIDMMDKDSDSGYNSFQQMLRMSDRLCALQRIALHSHEWTQEQLEYECQRVMSDECAGDYSWLNTQDIDLSTNPWDTSAISTSTTSSHERYVASTASQKEVLSRTQYEMLKQLNRDLAGTGYSIVSDGISTAKYTGLQYIEIKDERGYVFPVYLGSDGYAENLRNERTRYFLEYIQKGDDSNLYSTPGISYEQRMSAYETFKLLGILTQDIQQIEADIKRAELKYYEKMTLYTMDKISLDEYIEAQNEYFNKIAEYQSNQEPYAYYRYSDRTIEPPSSTDTYNSRIIWQRYDDWLRRYERLAYV